MSRILITFIFIAISIQSIEAQQRFDLNFMFEGRLRNAVFSHPGKPAPNGGYPVVFMLHGTSGTGEEFYEKSGWKELGALENFITVFPSSFKWCFVKDGVEERNTRWVNGSVTENPCSGPPQDYVDDTKFLKHLVKLLSDTLPINSKMVFLSGFSNGSNEMHKLAMEAGDVFKAFTGTCGNLSESDSAKPVLRVPVWLMHGTKDDRLTVPHSRDEMPFNDSILFLLNRPISRMLACQGLTKEYKTVERASIKTYQFNTSIIGEVSAPYWFSIVDEMVHQYPNGNNYPMNCPEIFWDFFKSAVTTSVRDEKPSALCKVYPNPTTDYLTIQLDKGVGKTNVSIYSLTSQNPIQEFENYTDLFRINISTLLTGTYILKISNDKNNWVNKIRIIK